MLVKTWRNGNSHTYDGENIKWGGVSVEGSLIASLKSKQKFTTWPNSTIGVYLKRNKTLSPHIAKCSDSISHSSQKVETSPGGHLLVTITQVACSDNGTPFGNTKEWSTHLQYNMDELQKHYAKWNKPDIRDRVLYAFIYTKCPQQAHL